MSLIVLTPAQRAARELWTSGDYARVASRLISDLGRTLVAALPIHPGQRVLPARRLDRSQTTGRPTA